MPLIEFKSELFKYYGDITILEYIEVDEFREFLLTFFKKQYESRQHDIYCNLYDKMVLGQINFIEYEEFIGKKKKEVKEISKEDNLKMIERILNSTAR